MLGHLSRRALVATLSLSAGLLALACRCTEPGAGESEPTGGSGGSGPMIVHGRARFYSPSYTAQLDVKVHENERPFQARTMDIWWDGHDGGGPTYTTAPNARFIKYDLTNPDWEVDGMLGEYLVGDKYFRIKVIVWDKSGVNITGKGGKELEYEWVVDEVEPLPLWHQLLPY